MIKYDITYNDLNGNTKTMEAYFHLRADEILNMQMERINVGGWVAEQMATGNNRKLLEWFKDIFFMAYGVRTPDGSGFNKSPEVKEEFMWSEASAVLYERIVRNSEFDSFLEGCKTGFIKHNPKLPTIEKEKEVLPVDADDKTVTYEEYLRWKEQQSKGKINDKD